MEIGNNVRIDDFCVLSGKVVLGDYTHISAGCILQASTAGIIMEDFSNLSANVTIFAISDDYSGNAMSNPMIDDEFRQVTTKTVYLRRHVLVGIGSTILLGVDIGEGCSIGAMSLVKHSTRPWTINAGIPSKEIGERSKRILELEKQFLNKRVVSSGL
jgi:galactoside O-acetyltransferase